MLLRKGNVSPKRTAANPPSLLSRPLSSWGNLILVCWEESAATKGGSKSVEPEAGRALMECLQTAEGKAVIRIWMEPRGKEGEMEQEKGGLWWNCSPLAGWQRKSLCFTYRLRRRKDALRGIRTLFTTLNLKYNFSQWLQKYLDA